MLWIYKISLIIIYYNHCKSVLSVKSVFYIYNMQKSAETGSTGEILAREYLKNKNYTILFTNWRHKRSEIDIIAQDGKVIVFVEVKTRTNLSFGNPEDFVDANKMKKMQEAAEAYIEQFDWHGELRFDVIAIEKNYAITHFEDAFY